MRRRLGEISPISKRVHAPVTPLSVFDNVSGAPTTDANICVVGDGVHGAPFQLPKTSVTTIVGRPSHPRHHPPSLAVEAVAKLLFQELPQNREEEPLEAVGQDPRLEPPPKEPRHPVLRNNLSHGGGVADNIRVRLAVRLDDAEAVGAAVRHDRRGEANDRIAAELGGEVLGDGQRHVEGVVDAEPGKVAVYLKKEGAKK